MLLKQIGSQERATEVTHRRAVIFDIIPSAGRHHRTRLALCKQPLQFKLNFCTWIYHSFQETGCTLKHSQV